MLFCVDVAVHILARYLANVVFFLSCLCSLDLGLICIRCLLFCVLLSAA